MKNTKIIKTPHLIHYAKLVDKNGKFLKWIPKPRNETDKKYKKEIQRELQEVKKLDRKQYKYLKNKTKEETKKGFKELGIR